MIFVLLLGHYSCLRRNVLYPLESKNLSVVIQKRFSFGYNYTLSSIYSREQFIIYFTRGYIKIVEN